MARHRQQIALEKYEKTSIRKIKTTCDRTKRAATTTTTMVHSKCARWLLFWCRKSSFISISFFFCLFSCRLFAQPAKRNETEWDDAIEMSSYWSHLIAQKWKWWKWKNSTKCFIRNWKMIMSWWRTHVCRLYAADEWASITFSEKKRKIVKKVGGGCVGVVLRCHLIRLYAHCYL